jgi:hypothetical protein
MENLLTASIKTAGDPNIAPCMTWSVHLTHTSGFHMSNWGNGEPVIAIHAFHASSQQAALVNVENNITSTNLPMLSSLLDPKSSGRARVRVSIMRSCH